ncbi:MAG: tRNA epoxyqueuosine(34) reductase QueG, partial [Bdellovibrionales bacterium]|nr:tRNA epoxyqueuosine(34) reductase QueG [Bdellovibrionales bacterium]
MAHGQSLSIPYQELAELAQHYGLLTLAILPYPHDFSSQRGALEAWQQAGFAGEMSYMQRSSALFLDPRHVFEELKTIVCFGVRYQSFPRQPCPKGYARVARYALGRDYHRVLKQRLTRFCKALQDRYHDLSYRVVSDSIPLLERYIASQAGLGFIGKNTMLIKPGVGSFFFLAETLWNLEVEGIPRAGSEGTCGSCQRCLQQCPTSAFESAYQLDARRCISYLTIEKKGPLTLEERTMLHDWAFGCDVCQEVCPFNHRSLKEEQAADFEDFLPRGIQHGLLSLAELFALETEEQFLKRFAGMPLMRAGREGLTR